MANDDPKAPVYLEVIPSGEGQISALASANAPFVFFEGAHLSAICAGVCAVTLTALRPIGIRADGTAASDRVITANLRGSMSAMLLLRDQINALESLMNRQAGEILASVPAVPPTMQ